MKVVLCLWRKLTKVYLKMTAKRTELKSAFDAEYNLLTQERDKVKQALLNYCKENNVDSLKLQKVCFIVQLSRVIGRVIGNPCTNLYLRTKYLSSSTSALTKRTYAST